MTNNKSTTKIITSSLTGKKKSFKIGVLLSIILIATPFLFYTYRYAPKEPTWETFLGTIESGTFKHVQLYLHALFTKLILVLLTGIWFMTSKNWWKYAILIPFTMFLFQLSGVINFKNNYIDEYDFWYSLPVILPILFFLIYISYRISKRQSRQAKDLEDTELKDEVDEEISRIFSDKL